MTFCEYLVKFQPVTPTCDHFRALLMTSTHTGHVPHTAQSPKILKMVKWWFWAVPKHMLKKWPTNGHRQKGAGPRRNPKLSKTLPCGPQGGIFLSLGFFLGRLPFGGDHFLITFLHMFWDGPKPLFYLFWDFLGFGQSRGHGLYEQPPLKLKSA